MAMKVLRVVEVDEACPRCRGTGTISISVVHPSNPNLDTWQSQQCGCVRLRPTDTYDASADPPSDQHPRQS